MKRSAKVIVVSIVVSVSVLVTSLLVSKRASPSRPEHRLDGDVTSKSEAGASRSFLRSHDIDRQVSEGVETRASIGGSSSNVRTTDSKIADLKAVMDALPDQQIPELKLLSEKDWSIVASGDLETVDDYRKALSSLRGRAERRFAELVQPALRSYVNGNEGDFPQKLLDISSKVPAEVEPAMLQRYILVPASEVKNVKVGGKWAFTQSNTVDPSYDSTSVIGPNGFGRFTSTVSAERIAVEPVIKRYQAANSGAVPESLRDLEQYASNSDEIAALRTLEEKLNKNR